MRTRVIEEHYKQFMPAEKNKLTWKEIKELVEAAGVKDDDEIDSIDISWGELQDFQCYKDEDFGWQIKLES